MKRLRNFILNSFIAVSIVFLGSGCAGLMLAGGLTSLAGAAGGSSAAAMSAGTTAGDIDTVLGSDTGRNVNPQIRQILLQLHQQNQNQAAIIAVQQQTLREVAQHLERASATSADDPETTQDIRATARQLSSEIQGVLIRLEAEGVPSPAPAASPDSTPGPSNADIVPIASADSPETAKGGAELSRPVATDSAD